ncbi:repressor LexA [Candidatus Parcubacteria bacterium]|nr:MAG: repressor LexA [Candidatus Parcubacteria bacterium]
MKPALLTANQRCVYDFIKACLAQRGEAPTLAEIGKAVGAKSIRSVTQYLKALESKGLIRRGRFSRRGIQIVEDDPAREEILQVPVFASAGCGSPSVIADRQFDEYIPVAASLISGRENVYVIRAVGSSMEDAGIHDGDFVLTEMTQNVQTGDIVVAIIDDNAVIKKIAFGNNAIVLTPVTSDSEHKAIILRRDFQIFGKVIQVIQVERMDDYQIIPIEDEERAHKRRIF